MCNVETNAHGRVAIIVNATAEAMGAAVFNAEGTVGDNIGKQIPKALKRYKNKN
jgi:hypothetical protein